MAHPLATRLRAMAATALLLALALAFLWPALQTGYWAEDLCQSIAPRAQMVLQGKSFGAVVTGAIRHTLLSGRFFPLTAALMPTVHTLCTDAFQYKAFILGANLVDLLLFLTLVTRLTGRSDFGRFAACITLGLIQYRVILDPSLGFYGQMQILLAGLLLSLLTLQLWLDRQAAAPGTGTGWLAASVGLFLACCLLYEVSYTLIVLHVALLHRASTRWRTTLRRAGPFLVVVGVCGLQSFLIRWLHPGTEYWHRTDLTPSIMAQTLAGQISAGLPLSYFLCDPQDLFPSRPRSILAWLLTWKVGLLCAGGLGLCLHCLPARESGRPAVTLRLEARWLVALGASLAVMPALMLSISPYHQAQIGPGVGWIPVLLQCYGVGLVVSGGLWWATESTRLGGPGAPGKRLATAIGVALLLGITARANEEVVRCFTAVPGSPRYRGTVAIAGGGYQYQRELLEAAFRAGLLDPVPSDARVDLAREYPYWYDRTYSRWFFATYAGKSVTTQPPSGAQGLPGSFRVRDSRSYRGTGFVVLSRSADDSGPATSLRLFVRHPDLGPTTTPPDFQLLTGATESTDSTLMLQLASLPRLRSGPGWALFALDPHLDAAQGETLEVVFRQAPGGSALVRGESDDGRAISERVRR